MVIKKVIQQWLDYLKDITSQAVTEDTDLEKLKSLQTTAIPRVEKATMELESMLQKYSRTCDAVEVEEMSDIVFRAIEEASQFVKTETSIYNDNEG